MTGLVLRVWLRFAAVFGAQLALFAWAEPLLVPRLTHWTAAASGFVLRAIGVQARVEGDVVVNALDTFRVIWECTGITPVALFLAAVAAYPSTWRARLIGLGGGVPLILLVNQLRLVSLVFIAHRWPALAEAAHVLVWQTLILFVTVLLWLVWLLRFADRREPGVA